ncbi:hypothetical protein N7456_010888 [Penicillium angulare]|uniref:HNH nuclease domain-containing protein n=1 Tax=Penicillium angulare TaxID=116970 RepID=A0A9W9K063_9EURO|nr:hypothetical protein N7456_010888 [Penicillium angulare]
MAPFEGHGSPTASLSLGVSKFLEAKTKELFTQEQHRREYHAALLRVQNNQSNNDNFKYDISMALRSLTTVLREIRFLNKCKITIAHNMTDELYGVVVPDQQREEDIFEETYTSVLASSFDGLSGQQNRSTFPKHDRVSFQSATANRYQALFDYGGYKLMWCHMTGLELDKALVQTVHIVPKGLDGEEIGFLFGESNFDKNDPRNGITLHKSLAMKLETAEIAIIPALLPPKGEVLQWKCFVIKEDIIDATACIWGSRVIKFRELHNKHLKFLTPNRPARRYLFFRFFMTYLKAKKEGNTYFTSMLEQRREFWASPGPYLERSALLALARMLKVDLPPSILERTTLVMPTREADINSMVPGAALQISHWLRISEATEKEQGCHSSTSECDGHSAEENTGESMAGGSCQRGQM